MTLDRYVRNQNESNRREEYCVDVDVDLDLEEGLAVKESQCRDPFRCVINYLILGAEGLLGGGLISSGARPDWRPIELYY